MSISNAQRAPLPWASWAGTVHHGLPLELHRPHYDAGRYLVFLGRVSPEKRVDRAIAIARPRRAAAQDRGQDRRGRSRTILPRKSSPCSPPRPSSSWVRSTRRAKEAAAGRRSGAAVSDRLAGALRPCDDRGDGLRHARDSICPGLGSGGRRSRHHGLSSLPASRKQSPASSARGASTAASAGGSSSAASAPPAWRGTTAPSTATARRAGVGGEREHGGNRVLHPGARSAGAGAHVRAQARRDVRPVQRLRRHRGRCPPRGGALSSGDAVSLAAGAEARRRAAVTALLGGAPGQPAHGSGPHQSRHLSGRQHDAAARLAPHLPLEAHLGRRLLRAPPRSQLHPHAPRHLAVARVCGRFRRHLRGARRGAPPARAAAQAASDRGGG